MKYKIRLTFIFVIFLLIISLVTATDYCPEYKDNNTNFITIGTEDNLQDAINNAPEGSTLLLEDGIYSIPQTIIKKSITIRSENKDREKVILDGEYRKGHSILSIQAPDVTIADLTIKRAYYHPIHVSGGGDNVLLYNLHIIDGREQFVKVNPDYDLTMNDNGTLACSLLEMTDAGRQKIHTNPTPGFKCYTGGIDAHKAEGWTVRDNTFKNIYCTNGGLAEHAIHFWSQCKDTEVYRNRIENCARGIGFGLGSEGGTRDYENNPYESVSGYIGHINGIIYNNIIAVDDNVKQYYDTGISLEQAYGAKIYHNTLPTKPTWSSIDYRFSNTYADIVNNIVYKITKRNGAQASLSSNLDNNQIDEYYFQDYSQGNYRLTKDAVNAIDSGTDVSVSQDIQGKLRINNPDIGAYEITDNEITDNENRCIIRVGKDRKIKIPSQAQKIAKDGCIIEIDAGIYENDIVQWTQNNLIIRGIDGYSHLDAKGFTIPNRKAIWVIKGANTTVENIEFSGAAVLDRNGAGIRQEGTNLIIRNCSFHDNEMGILTTSDKDSDILIEYSEFKNHGKSNGGFSHNIYIGHVKRFTIQYSYTHHAEHGHNIKSRAHENYILYNRIEDGEDGYSSYLIDLPNGGKSFIIGNVMQQGPKAENYHAISYAAEGASNPEQKLYFASNTLINQRKDGRGIRFKGDPYVNIVNNIFNGFQSQHIIVGTPNYYSHNIENAEIIDKNNLKFQLVEDSAAIDAGNLYGNHEGYSLDPAYEYIHPIGRRTRQTINSLDIGAYEYSIKKDNTEINLSIYKDLTKIYVAATGSDSTGDGSLDKPFMTVRKAASFAKPGTEIIIRSGTYSGGEYITDLSGTESAPIIIRGEDSENKPVFSGKTEAFHFTNAQHIILLNIEVTKSTGNGINIDDGGEYEGIINSIWIEGLKIHNIGTGGNQDCLKLSGINNLTINNCEFYNCGGKGSGSAIDMVGCHNITIQKNYIHDTHGTGIQAKGGSEDIIIRRNKFKNAGVRAINMGGSTGLQFFRPLGADFEAKDIRVYGNIFIGSETPLAYVGCDNCKVYNNLLYMPDTWLFRILQESVDGFIPVRDGEFVNNIVYFSKEQIRTYVNIGPNTDADSFTIKNNIFYSTSGDISDINLPGTKQTNYLGIDPFLDSEKNDFRPNESSPVWEKGLNNDIAVFDYKGISFPESTAIGHFAYFDIPEFISNSSENDNEIISEEELEDVYKELNETDADEIIKQEQDENSTLSHVTEKIKIGTNITKGTILINETLEDYLFYIIKNKALIDNINKITFSERPFKVTDSEIIFLLDKKDNVHAITYSVESTVISDKTGISTEAYARDLTIEEKVDVYSGKLLQIMKILLIAAAAGITVGFIYYYFRGKQE
jgi:hypothetical protein